MEDPMLRRSTDDHVLSVSPTVKKNGHKVRQRKAPLSATEASLIAVALVNGKLSAAQACRFTGANAGYFSLVNGLSDREKELLAHGKLSLAELHNGKRNNGNGSNGNGGRHVETLLEHMQRSSIGELVQAVRAYGAGQLFDPVIAPALDQDAAGAAVVLKVND
jgi:hypothetical protein